MNINQSPIFINLKRTNAMKIKYSIIVLAAIALMLFVSFSHAISQVTTISGRVTDSEGTPLEGVAIEVLNTDFSTSSKKDGTYKIVVTDLAEAQVKFSLKEYEAITRSVKLAERQMQLDIRLTPSGVKIKMTSFRSQSVIKGTVTGLDPAQFEKYKIVAYVLTDQWYIHPYAENAEGRGFSYLDEKGNWELQTVWRGYQSYKLAFLLVSKNIYVPPVVRLSPGPPESSLLSAVKCGDRYSIIDAPKGI
jgi:hypothetical protein